MPAAIGPEPEPDYAALAAFRQALRGFTAFSEAAARAAGLTPRGQAMPRVRSQARAREVEAIGPTLARLLARFGGG
ncbi:MAG: hypothetical protein ACP5NP_12920 [Acetobacteraceae bacterium]